MNGKEVLAEVELEYLGLLMDSDGPRDAKLRERVSVASAILRQLVEMRVLARGMSVRQARNIFMALVASKWAFACFVVPSTEDTIKALDAVDAGSFPQCSWRAEPRKTRRRVSR